MNLEKKNINTECGLVSIVSRNLIDIEEIIYSLTKLQHRGRESYGICYLKDKSYYVEKYLGLVDKYELSEVIMNTKSTNWCGHVRYSTSGKKNDKTKKTSTFSFLNLTQPIKFNIKLLNQNEKKAIFIYNGNIPLEIWQPIFKKYNELKTYYNEKLSKNIDINDSLLIIKLLQLIASNYNNFCDVLKILINLIDRAFCIVIKLENEEWIIRDKYGVRPLVLGLSKDFKTFIVASENCCFKELKYDLISTFKPGSISKINYETFNISEEYLIPNNTNSTNNITKHCIFEYFYFMRKNTTVNNINVTLFREEIGRLLFKDLQKKINLYDKLKNYATKNQLIICGIPESGIIQAKSFSNEIGGKYIQIIEKNKKGNSDQRTFILENNKSRLDACRKKYIVSPYNQTLMKDKVIILVDDSIVRGNTIKYLIDFVKSYKPKEIHFLSASPPIVNKCSYGVDFPDIEDLIASNNSITEIEKNLNLNSLTYLDKSYFTNEKYKNMFCLECFTK